MVILSAVPRGDIVRADGGTLHVRREKPLLDGAEGPARCRRRAAPVREGAPSDAAVEAPDWEQPRSSFMAVRSNDFIFLASAGFIVTTFLR